MKKIILITSLVLATIVLILVILLLTTGPIEEDFPQDGSFSEFEYPVTEEVEVAPQTGLVKTNAGGFVASRNFLDDPDVEVVDLDFGVYQIGSAPGVQGNIYEIYFYEGGSIIVGLQDENLSYARFLAEQELLERLGISEEEACFAQISVTVPWQISDEYSGYDLGLSFCPGSIAL